KEPTDRIVFNVNPGMSFGTGSHETTQLCIEALEDVVKPGDEILDLGCGSGILSIISLLLGAKSAVAVDIDENAKKTAYENAALNGIGEENYTVFSGNVIDDEKLRDEIGYGKYDVAVANIIADVICAIAPTVKKELKKDGIFIASGIIKDRIEDVYAALEENGFTVIDTSVKDEWVSITSKAGVK
ncbi:MAG: 50S ribosomal protein L11 methyltransferase, partial [Firmicutes bacterium]|nr:50S ribosomal protein L11 methyltransferase [Bacillota bacterium]